MRQSSRGPQGRQAARSREVQLTRRGFGPWARIYRPAEGGRRQCVQLAVLPWAALEARSWGSTDQLEPADIARVLGTYAARVLTPRGSTAVSGLEAMTALRPPTRAVKDEESGTWVSGPMPGSLTAAVDPAPVEAPDEHPAAAAHRRRVRAGLRGRHRRQHRLPRRRQPPRRRPVRPGACEGAGLRQEGARLIAGGPLQHRARPPSAQPLHPARHPARGPGLVRDADRHLRPGAHRHLPPPGAGPAAGGVDPHRVRPLPGPLVQAHQ